MTDFEVSNGRTSNAFPAEEKASPLVMDDASYTLTYSSAPRPANRHETESRYPPRALMAVVSSDGTGHALSTVRSQLLDSLKGSATFDSLKVRPAAQAHTGTPFRLATERRARTVGADAGAQLPP